MTSNDNDTNAQDRPATDSANADATDERAFTSASEDEAELSPRGASATETPTSDDPRQKIGDLFERTTDPLDEFEEQFHKYDEENEEDVFDEFFINVLDTQDLNQDTRYQYRLTFRQWKDFMERKGRHPACPNEDHVLAFIDYRLRPKSKGGKGNEPRTVSEKITKLGSVYRHWQDEPAFPHPTNYDPFKLARGKRKQALTPSKDKEYRDLSLDEVRSMMASVADIRRRSIIGLGFKLGLRAGEVANIRLEDINITNAELARHHPTLATHPKVKEYEDAIYIPPSDERAGNKSKRWRVLPLDDETRRILLRYLLIRPDAGKPWLFLSKKTHTKIDKKVVNKEWKAAFHPRYAETDQYEAVTSHYGRHWFTSYWKVQENVSRELVQYMRGDKLGDGAEGRGDAIDTYLHACYKDIEDLYRERIYKLKL